MPHSDANHVDASSQAAAAPQTAASGQVWVYDQYGCAEALAPRLDQGGEGAVYPLADRPQVLVKLYHAEQLCKRGTELEQKIAAMARQIGIADGLAVSWPRISVYDDQQRWIGYAMRRAQGTPMKLLAHPMLYRKHFPSLDRRMLCDALLHLVETVEALHQRGVCVGDYNLNNILCAPGTGRITLIDCDSYQLREGGRCYPCPVGSADLTPKEHHGRAFTDVVRTPQSEAFSLAIVLFQCLMLGRHPYDVVGGEDPVQNLLRGYFPYGRGNQGIPLGPWYNIWSHIPFRLKNLFVTTFTEGADDPARRVDVATWKTALQCYRRELDKGWHEADMQPASAKSADYRGQHDPHGPAC